MIGRILLSVIVLLLIVLCSTPPDPNPCECFVVDTKQKRSFTIDCDDLPDYSKKRFAIDCK